jgi:hypothetical protein
MWLIAEYSPGTLFSLKPAWATSSGGKSLLLPTPFAVKMALLDVACRTLGVTLAEPYWPAIRGLRIAFHGPEQIVVTNTFTKILKPRRGDPEPGGADAGPFQKTIGFREYVFFSGAIRLAFEVHGGTMDETLASWLWHVNYLGKRGGLIQLTAPPARSEALPEGFLLLDRSAQEIMALDGIMQALDDVGPEVSFAQVNIFTDAPLRLGKDRLIQHIVAPYRLSRSSRGYSLYERIVPTSAF